MRNGSFVGAEPWAYTGTGRPTDARNAFGWLAVGDPMHEAPGWYSIYDKDATTIALIKNLSQELSKITA